MQMKRHSLQCPNMTCSNDADIRKISKVLCIIVFFMVLELWGHWRTNSLSLLADSLHLLVDVLGFVVSLVSLGWAKKGPNDRMTFGYHRVEVIGSLLSIMLIWVAVGYLVVESVHKYIHPAEIDGRMFFTIAVVGFFVNCVCIYILHHDDYHQHDRPRHRNLNIRAAYVHVLGDLVQSIGMIFAGMVTYLYPSKAIVDVLCTLLFSILVLVSTGFVFRDAIYILAEGAPEDVDLERIKADILEIENVYKIVEFYSWSVSTNRRAVSVKVLADDLLINDYELILHKIKELLRERHAIDLSMVQIDTPSTFYGDNGFVVDGVVIDLKSQAGAETPSQAEPSIGHENTSISD
jgi:solute carrier family 30 (zinc transporter), member 2